MAGTPIPVIDLFAGPGGLGEGFSSLTHKDGHRSFEIRLSIEKEHFAHETLKLRTFYRQFAADMVPDAYYDVLRGALKLDELYGSYPAEAKEADAVAWKAELGSDALQAGKVRERIADRLGAVRDWVLIGGPPCQAYSLAGRSRNKGNEAYVAEEDPRQHLYVEYLSMIADRWPTVFVMENVKGLLSAKLDDQSVFSRILADLRDPAKAVHKEGRGRARTGRKHEYRVYSFSTRGMFGELSSPDFVVRSECYGIPQARHRVIILGVRGDISGEPNTLSPSGMTPCVADAISGLPVLRSGLSKEKDGQVEWAGAIRRGFSIDEVAEVRRKAGSEVADRLNHALSELVRPPADRGAEFVESDGSVGFEKKWFLDQRLKGVCNHSTRGHIAEDLWRYIYAACYGETKARSPELADFPARLLPAHKSATEALAGSLFADRFRVQLADKPSTTVVSHISKDGHYYIHPEPEQCRSLTVREAARLQTFPDNYFFVGPRTPQYTQVGNAVPPLLARQIAEVVSELLAR